MPRIFLPAATPRNNALLSGHTQEEAFALHDSDGESTTDEESPDLLAPNQRGQWPQRRGVKVGRSNANASTAAGNKRACGRNEEEDGVPPKRPKGQQGELYAVVFMTVALGITLADDGDADGSLVVADKEATAKEGAASEISVGDRLHAIGGTSTAGLSVDSVQRLIVRGSRPLEIVFRRRFPSGGRGTTAAKGKAASTQKRKQRPLGGLEQPSRDCLLDMISNIATQEDDSVQDSQPQETQAGVIAGASRPVMDIVGGVHSPSPSLLPVVLSPPIRGKTIPPAASAAGAATAAAATSNAGERAGEDDGEIHLQHHGIECRQGPEPSAWAPASPSSPSSSSSTEVDLFPPATGNDTGGAAATTAPLPSPCPHDAREAAAPGRSAGAAQTSGLAQTVGTTFFTQAPPPLALRGGVGAADTAKESTRSKKTKAAGGGGSSSRKGRVLHNNTNKKGKDESVNNNSGLTGVPALNPGGGGSDGGRGGGGGSSKKVTGASSSPSLIPEAAEVERLLSKLGPKGVSELALYRCLSFDELVRVCRYTGGIDLSKRLPKATMAELLNSLCAEKGALAVELRNARTAAGAGAGTRRTSAGAGATEGSARGAGPLNGGGARTPARPFATTSAPPSGTPPRTPATLSEASSPPLPPSFPHEGGRFCPLPPPPHRLPSPRPSEYSSTTAAMTTPQQHRERQRLPPAGSRGARAVAVTASQTMCPGEDRGGGGEYGRSEGGEEDDRHCWEDWDYPDNARGGGGRDGEGRGRNNRHGGEGCRAGDVQNPDDVDEEAAWWSREPDHDDWSPCSSPTAAPATPRRTARIPLRGASSPTPPPSIGTRRGEREDEQQEPRRRNPLLPVPSSTGSSSVSGPRHQRGRSALSLWSGRFSGGGAGFTALPKWILRSVRSIGTQVTEFAEGGR